LTSVVSELDLGKNAVTRNAQCYANNELSIAVIDLGLPKQMIFKSSLKICIHSI